MTKNEVIFPTVSCMAFYGFLWSFMAFYGKFSIWWDFHGFFLAVIDPSSIGLFFSFRSSDDSHPYCVDPWLKYFLLLIVAFLYEWLSITCSTVRLKKGLWNFYLCRKFQLVIFKMVEVVYGISWQKFAIIRCQIYAFYGRKQHYFFKISST